MRLMDQVRDTIRKKHYSIRTEQTYCQWIRRFILFNGKRHPLEMGEKEISNYLSHLATDRNVAASTQNQALNAIVFLYKQVLKYDIGDFSQFERAKTPSRLPVVLTKKEVALILPFVSDKYRLLVELLYGCGLRLMECIRLRVKDIDFETNQVIVRHGKGGKDRVTMLPEALKQKLQDRLIQTKTIHEQDLKNGFGEAYLP